ncbi:MAG: response regulator [Nitrospira sp.]|nr:response regulator [Nitrospira sp.]
MNRLVRSALIVDDNDALRESLALVVEREGFEPVEAQCGEAAFELVETRRFDLAVLDLNLPDTTGVTIYRRMVIHKPLPACIFITAEAGEELIDDAMRLNPLELLRKPFEVSIFRALVRMALRG